MCIVNRRGEPNLDNFTSVSPREHAVVAYIITPYECLQNETEFKVLLVQDCLKQFQITPNKAKIPDHSILKCMITLSTYNSTQTEDEYSQMLKDPDLNSSKLNRKYKVDSVPPNIFTDEQCLNQLSDVIHRLETTQNAHEENYSLYKKLVSTLHAEMDTHLRYSDINKGTIKRKRYFGKPWWCDELNML